MSAQEWLDAWQALSDQESRARYLVEYRTVLNAEEYSVVVYRDGARDAERVKAETMLGGRIVWVPEGETRYSCDPEERSCRRSP